MSKSAKRLGNMAWAIGYIRLSPREKEDPRLGLKVQRDLISNWAERAGVTVLEVFEDVDVSGDADLAERPGLQKALETLREEHAGILVVAKRDRLARNVGLAVGITKAVASRRGVVRSADGVGGDGLDAADELTATVVDATARYELRRIRERTAEALAAKSARGELVGTAPFGYRAVEDPDRKNKRGAPLRVLVEDEDEQKVISFARALREQGDSLREIARTLAKVGFKSRAGTGFTHVQVGKMVEGAER